MEQMDHKKHRSKVAGRKAERKSKKDQKGSEGQETARQRNPKAFAIQSVVKAAKKFHRSQDVKMKKIHTPLPDRSVLEPPPVIVAVAGPPKVGKTLLIQCIVKNFTRTSVTNIKGPVTVVSGKKRRLTLIEVNNDISNMIDVAKVADLVILMIDASFGFEMEVFEFLNICQVHGFPKVMGVLNHLDTFHDNKRTRKVKKRLKDRFWTEIYQGAKLFYLSGMVNGEYQRTEIHNLCRFISVMKFRPLIWRSSHSYILADRMEDVTREEEVEKDPKCDRRITLYGYNRGQAIKNHQAIHIAGVGDFRIAEVESLPDPCPTPDMEKRRSLNQKERFVYAPMSGVGGVLYDKDAVYIDVGGSHHFHSDNTEELTPYKELLSSLGVGKAKEEESDEEELMEELVPTGDGRFRRKAIFGDEGENELSDDDEGVSKNADKSDAGSDEEEDESDEEDGESDVEEDDSDEEEDRVGDGEEGSDDEEEEEEDDNDQAEAEDDENDISDEDLQWKTFTRQQAEADFKMRKESRRDYHKLIYGQNEEEKKEEEDGEEEDEELGGLFRVLKRKSEAGKEQKYNANLRDSSKFPVDAPHDWQIEEVRQLIADCFVTGRWDKSEDALARLQEDDELYGDFEDLETGEKHTTAGKDDKDEDADDDNNEEDGEAAGTKRKKTKAEMTAEERRQDRLEKKRKRKEEFDARYDIKTDGDDDFYQAWKAEMEEQAKLNRAEFENLPKEMRQDLEGFRPGLYLRVEVAGIPCEFVEHFNPSSPLIIGGLTNLEENVGYVQVRFKKHRWYKKTLKTKNPLVFSIGWRRFQSMPVYSVQDHNMRQRAIKYTLEHLHCMASFWGPITPQGSGVLAVQSVNEVSRGFRIAGTGVVLELDKSVQVMKKLKLVGTPYKIFKKTAYIQGMFNSHLEVAKFEGAIISTVSKVRGVIKKGARRLADTGAMLPAGTFRATFEDRILPSDIVFLRTWYPVEVPKYYNPVTTLLGEWMGMKTVGQLRHERGLAVPQKQDSLYKPVERKARKPTPLVIPRGLQKELPFKVTPKNLGPAAPSLKRVTVVNEPSETKKAKLLHQLKVVHEYTQRNKHAIMRQRAHKHQAQLAKREALKEKDRKKAKSELYRVLGKMQQAKAARDRGRSST